MTAAGRYGAQVAAATVTLAVGLGLAAATGVLAPPVGRGAAAGLLVALGNAALATLGVWFGRGGSQTRFMLVFFGGLGLRTLVVLTTLIVLLARVRLDAHGLVFGLIVGWTVYTVLELMYLARSGRPTRRRSERRS